MICTLNRFKQTFNIWLVTGVRYEPTYYLLLVIDLLVLWIENRLACFLITQIWFFFLGCKTFSEVIVVIMSTCRHTMFRIHLRIPL